MEKKYLGSTGLAKFLENLYNVFSQVGHTHTKSQITDFPTIPTKVSQLDNDSGFVNHDENTTYTLTKDGSTITLTGTDGSTMSVEDSDTIISVDSELSNESLNPVQNKVIKSEFDAINALIGDASIEEQIDAAIAGIPQADWNQADSSASDYVKNRTHYAETVDSELIPKTNHTFGVGPQGTYSMATVDFVEGNTYTVMWDEQEYECICYQTGNGLAIGCSTFIGVEGFDNGEPFVFYAYIGAGATLVMVSEAGEHTFSVLGKVEKIHKLDPKYLPDSIATDDEIIEILVQEDMLVAVTDSDGDILADENGNIILW